MLSVLLIIWLCIITLMTIAWITSLLIKNPGVIDVFWSIAITLAGLNFSFLGATNPVKFVFQSLLIIWAIRLAGYLLLKRIIPQHVDKRYLTLSENWKGSKKLGFWLNFQLQGLLALIIATPFLFINTLLQLSPLGIIAIIVIVIGIIGESIADYQLQSFKKQKLNAVCNVGLWRYSRHPNYFFEWLIWVGFFIAGLHSGLSWLGVISPLLLLLLMLKVTGPLTEQGSIKSKGEKYLDYQQRTSMFIPLPPKSK